MTVAENLVLGAEPQEGPAAGLQDGGRAHARALGALRPGGRPGRPRAGPRRGRPAAGGDPARAVPRREGARARRADRGAHRPGGAGPVRGPAHAQGRGHRHHLHLAQAQRGARRRRPDHGPAARREGRHGAVRGRHGALAGHADGRPRRAPARREGRHARPASRCSRWRACRRATTAGCRPCATCRLEVRAGEIVGARGHRRQRPERADRDDHGPAQARRGHDHRRRPRRHARRARGDTLDAGVSHIAEDRHRRGLVLEFDLAENLALREYKTPAFSNARLPLAEEDGRARAHAAQGVRRPRRRPGDARGLAVGRQPAEGRDRARAHRRPAGDHRRAADARAGRGRDRVRAPAARRGARRGPRRAARLARDGGDPVA